MLKKFFRCSQIRLSHFRKKSLNLKFSGDSESAINPKITGKKTENQLLAHYFYRSKINISTQKVQKNDNFKMNLQNRNETELKQQSPTENLNPVLAKTACSGLKYVHVDLNVIKTNKIQF